MRRSVTFALAALPLAALAACGSAHPAAAHQAAARAASAPPLTTAQRRFVAAYAAALARKGETLTASPAKVAAVGENICSIRKDGTTQSAVLKAAGDHAAVTLAEKYLCPQYAPYVLLKMSGSGIENSAPFQVNDGTVTARYSYDCATQGSGNFIADLQTGDQASLNSDDQSIANALSSGGHATTTVYPQDVGAMYHLAVNSECSWSVTLTSG